MAVGLKGLAVAVGLAVIFSGVSGVPTAEAAGPAPGQGHLPYDLALRVPHYEVEAALDPDQKRLTGQERVRWTNTTDQPQSTIFIRTYGVDPYYGPVRFTEMKVNATPAPFTLDWTVVRVPLAQTLAPGASVDLEWSFSAELPDRYDPVSYSMVEDSNMKSTGAEYGAHWLHGVVTLSDAFPRVLQAPPDEDEPVEQHQRLDASWAVSLTSPAGWTIAGSGVEVARETLADGRIRRHLVANDTTAFSLVGGKDLQRATRVTPVGTVNAYYPAAAEAVGQDVAEKAAAALEFYASRFGPPFEREIDLVAVPFRQYGGMYMGGGLIFLARWLFTDQTFEKEPQWAAEPALAPLAQVDMKAKRRTVVYHEMAHGYWGGLVDGHAETGAWMAEGMSEWMTLYALEQLDGAGAADAERQWMQRKFQAAMALGEGDGPLRQPLQRATYYRLYYDKGALFLDGLRRQVGDEAFFKGLRRVIMTYRGGVIPDDEPMQAILSAAGNTPALQAYVHRWLDEKHASEDLGPLPESALQLLKSP